VRAGAPYRLGSIAPKPRCAAVSRISPPGLRQVNAETIVEIRALRNEITHMHMIDAAIATERDETLAQLNRFTWVEMRIDFPVLGAANCPVPKFFKRKVF
jgi:hypothetical protein